MLNKFLLIGVGGSGGKTLRYTWQALDRHLSATGWNHGIPDAWQFLHLDVPEFVDVVESDVPADVSSDLVYKGMAREPHRFPHYDERVLTHGPLSVYAGWRVDPDVPLRPPSKGAGQRRVVGRVVMISEFEAIGGAIDRAVSRLMDAGVDGQLAALNRYLGTNKTINAGKATAVVITSLGGGSGSGGFLDVIELLKRKASAPNEWLEDSLVTVMYSADTFLHLAKEKRLGVEPNSAAALSEFVSAFEHEGDVSSDEDDLVSAGHGPRPISGMRVGTTNILVGAGNGEVNFADGHDAYRAVGKAFATFMVNEDVQHEFQTYLPNAAGATCASDFLVTDPSANFRPLMSMGYANVSLGRSLFARYAEERLAKVVLHRLLRGHRENVKDLETRDNLSLIKERVGHVRDDFFAASGLWEITVKHNDVLDKLRDVDAKRRGLDKVKTDVLKAIQAKPRKANGQSWLQTLTARFDAAADAFTEEEEKSRKARAQEWVPEVHAQLVDATARFAGLHGLPVTIRLLEELDAQVGDAARELTAAAEAFETDQTNFLNDVTKAFRNLWDQMFGHSDKTLSDAAQRRREALQRGTEASLYRYASKLLTDARSGLIGPLRATLESAAETLDTGELGEFKAMVEQWSDRELTPRLSAAPNELLLEPEERFPEQLDELLGESFAGGGGQSRAVAEIIAGTWQSIHVDNTQRGQQTLIARGEPWWPVESSARPQHEGASTATFNVSLDPEIVLHRCRYWVLERSPVAEFVRAKLSDWLHPNRKDAAARAGAFADRVDEAVRKSAPLVAINTKAHQAVHTDTLPPHHLVVGRIPIGANHKAYARVLSTLTAAGVDDGQLGAIFDATALNEAVEITSFLGHTVHPVVVSSLMKPIQSDWDNRKTSIGGRDAFWAYRRARPIPSFNPLSPSRQRALVRGWLTATVLGHVGSLTARSWSAKPLSIWTPGGTRKFPSHLVGDDPVVHASVLPALMESMILAYVAYGIDERQPLEAYIRLIDLGTDGKLAPGRQGPYKEVNRELGAWIAQGGTTESEGSAENAPTPPAKLAGTARMTAAKRRQTIQKYLSDWNTTYAREAKAFKLNEESSLEVPRGWEIRDVVAKAATELVAAVRTAPLKAPGEAGSGGDEGAMGR